MATVLLHTMSALLLRTSFLHCYFQMTFGVWTLSLLGMYVVLWRALLVIFPIVVRIKDLTFSISKQKVFRVLSWTHCLTYLDHWSVYQSKLIFHPFFWHAIAYRCYSLSKWIGQFSLTKCFARRAKQTAHILAKTV